MSMYQSIETASDNGVDCVVVMLVSSLEAEFGRGAGEALTHRFLEAEEADFHWDARVAERWIGAYDGADDEEGLELDRNTICGRLNGTWFCATMFVDGDSEAHTMMGCRTFRSLGRARDAMLHAR